MSHGDQSLQERYAPRNTCFGCGPANDRGLRIRSFPSESEPDTVVLEWQPERHHEAWPGMLNGGIIGALFDCHMNWCAAYFLLRRDGLEALPPTVTAEFSVAMKRPTPTVAPVRVTARPVSSDKSRVVVEAQLEAGGKVTATSRGTFVAVEPGHPAYHRW